MDIPVGSTSSSGFSTSMVGSMGITDPTDTVMQAMLAGWLAGLDAMKSANDAALKGEKTSGDQEIQDAAKVATIAQPQLVQPQALITSTGENASRAQDGNVAGVSSDVAKQTSAMYAYIMSHALEQMSGQTIGSDTLDSWMRLGTPKAVSLLAFVTAANANNQQVDEGSNDDGNAAAIAQFKQNELNAGLKFAHAWLEGVQKLADNLKQLDKEQATLKAMQAFSSEARNNPTLLDATHVQTIAAVAVLALLINAGPSPILSSPDNTAKISQVSMMEATSMNPTMGQMDTTAAIAMIAALMAQVAQAQIISVQIAEKPVLDSKKVSETFATENAKKMMGFVEDRGYQVFLKSLVEGMVGKENLDRNVALLKINMLMNALWLVGRAETDGVTFIEIMMTLKQYLSKDPKEQAKSTAGNSTISKIKGQLLAKIKEQIDGFGGAGAADLEKGILSMMSFMEGKGETGDISELTDPKKMVGFLLPEASPPKPASVAVI